MTPGPEDISREQIDRMPVSAGWAVQDAKAVNLYAKQGVAIREFELKSGFGTADYLLYVDGKAAGVIEAKKGGATLTGVEIQSAKYSKGLPDSLPAWTRPLPFCYQSTVTSFVIADLRLPIWAWPSEIDDLRLTM